MNEKLQEIVNAVPVIKKIIGVDTAIAVWDTDATVVAYDPIKNSKLNFPVGYQDNSEGSKIREVIRTGKPGMNKIPKEVFGTAFEGLIIPIFDKGQVVGVITKSYYTENRERIVNNANSLTKSIEETDKSIDNIRESSKTLSSNMSEIKDVTDSVVLKLDEAIEIVKAIQQNAKQSNILALNASIESARAGEAGKGFAVVSDEMRKFSRLSAEASDKISDSLNQIVKSLNEVKEHVDTSKDIVGKQTNIVDNLDEVFDDVSKKANETIEVCKKINII
ncbi:MAG: hypothetical protein E7214_04620 [Clostridium sp.]|nr:hypothetical protein [Clostridium sp.]